MNDTARNAEESPASAPLNPPDFEPYDPPAGGGRALRAVLPHEPEDTHNPLWTVAVAMGVLFGMMAALMALG